MQTKADPQVIEWLDTVPSESVWITSVTLFEARFGLALLPEGKRRNTLISQFNQVVEKDLQGRTLLFDQVAAEQAALLAAYRRKAGYTVDMRDTFIAGIALARKATVATRNIRHFNDLKVEVVNPWDSD